MKTIFNTKNVDPMNQPLFLGKDLGVQRYDVVKYPVFRDLDSKQMMNFSPTRRNRTEEGPW